MDFARLIEVSQKGACAGYELWRLLNKELSVRSRVEGQALREQILGMRPPRYIKRPLDTMRWFTTEIMKYEAQIGGKFPELSLTEQESILFLLKHIDDESKRYLLLHHKTDTLSNMLAGLQFYDEQLRVLQFQKEAPSGLGNAFQGKGQGDDDYEGKGDRDKGKGKKGKEQGKKGKEPKGKGKGKGRDKTPKGGKGSGKNRSQSRDKSKDKCNLCHQKGHWANECPFKQQGNPAASSQGAAAQKDEVPNLPADQNMSAAAKAAAAKPPASGPPPGKGGSKTSKSAVVMAMLPLVQGRSPEIEQENEFFQWIFMFFLACIFMTLAWAVGRAVGKHLRLVGFQQAVLDATACQARLVCLGKAFKTSKSAVVMAMLPLLQGRSPEIEQENEFFQWIFMFFLACIFMTLAWAVGRAVGKHLRLVGFQQAVLDATACQARLVCLGKALRAKLESQAAFRSSSAGSVHDYANWMLLDSGASVTILSEEFLKTCCTVVSRWRGSPILINTATNQTVSIDDEVKCILHTFTHDGSVVGVLVKGYVSNKVPISLLSTGVLGAGGWTFSNKGPLMRLSLGKVKISTELFANCSWVRVMDRQADLAETTCKELGLSCVVPDRLPTSAAPASEPQNVSHLKQASEVQLCSCDCAECLVGNLLRVAPASVRSVQSALS